MVLIGFMGAGKSTVGPLLAARMRWRFVDLDQVVERRSGRTIRRLFADHGEAEFRRLERESASVLLDGTELVLAAGGGWAMQPGTLDRVPQGTLVVWLRVRPDVAWRRVRHRRRERPLLPPEETRREREDVPETVRALARERESRYALAHYAVETSDRAPPEITEDIVTLIAQEGDRV